MNNGAGPLPNRAERFTPETMPQRPLEWREAIAAAISAAPKPGTALCDAVAGLIGPALLGHLKSNETDSASK
jgi:hypothetical protein